MIPLRDTTKRRIGFVLLVLIQIGVLSSIAISVRLDDWPAVLEVVVLGFTFGGVIALSLRAQPANGAVWALLWAVAFGLSSDLGRRVVLWRSDFDGSAVLAGDVKVAPADVDLVAALGLVGELILWVPGIFLLAIHTLALFPGGTAVSRRWRLVLLVSAAAMVWLAAVGAWRLAPWQKTPYDEIVDERFGVAGIWMLLMGPLLLISAASVVSLVRRYRRSSGDERVQFRWVVWALALFVFHIFAYVLWDRLGADQLMSTLALANIAVAFGIAIARHRLFDIDTIVSRSVTFGALALFIGGVYVAIVVGIGELLDAGAGFGLSVVASVLVAMAFQPVRRRVQRWANRLVFGERATPYEVLVRFSRRSAELSDEDLLDRVPKMIVDGTGAATATLWTRTLDGFVTGSVSPAGTARRRIDGTDRFEDLDADYSLPVFHDGELLGGLSLVKAGGETITPVEEELLADLASGLGLALRNARLTGQLRRQVAELEASRERVLAAADDARRTLENDLDSGPQQQLVALKVKLGPTRKLAERAGAEKTAALLTQLETDAGDAIQAVRDFAGGIYPPLLEAEGLTAAISQEANKAAIPVSVRGDSGQRYPREVEAAIYFAVLESLQNTAKYAQASSATVTLAATNGSLGFEVRDDGEGFDPVVTATGAGLTGMADRLDTIGGTLRIDSSPGDGTTITGSVPVEQTVPAWGVGA
ncbi:MAG: ATP-binding protein [Acidimicrobiales bacterium]